MQKITHCEFVNVDKSRSVNVFHTHMTPEIIIPTLSSLKCLKVIWLLVGMHS